MNAKTGFLGILLCSAAAFCAEDYSQWGYYRQVSVNTSPSGANVAQGQTNFPLLVRLNSGNFDFSRTVAGGADVRFAKLNGLPLPYQIEQWDALNNTAAIWVLLDIVMGNGPTAFRMYYGKSGAADSSNGPQVFSTSNNFQGVFHLGEAANDTARDATDNRFKGVPHNRGGSNPADSSGLIGRAKNFLGNNLNANGGSYKILTANGGHTFDNNALNFQNDSATFNGIPQYTISSWIYVDAFPARLGAPKGIVAKSAGLNSRQYHLRLREPAPNASDSLLDTNRADFNDGTGAVYTSGFHRLNPRGWYHLAAVRSGPVGGPNVHLYVDGGNMISSLSSLTQTQRSDYDVYIGSFSNDSGYFSGKIDEVEFSNVARDSNWIKLSYETQKPGANAVTVGSETMVGIQAWQGAHFSDNPFSFHLPEGLESARIQIVSVGGQVVWNRTLRKIDGLEELSWNETAGNGRPASPGIYVVRIQMLNADHKSMGMVERRIVYLP